jgi:tetrahydrodipicolinate N-succinyltransferase
MHYVNNTSKPIVFVGTNLSLSITAETCKKIGYSIAGIIDNDYYGQGHFQNIPVIATEQDLIDNKEQLNQYQFICTTNWQPPELKYPQHIRGKQKRDRFISVLEQSGLDIASIIHPHCQIALGQNHIGRGVIVESSSIVSPGASIQDWSTVLQWVGVGDGTSIGKNCVIQRAVMLTGDISIEDECYIGMSSKLLRDGIKIRHGTFVHPGLILMRDTQENEVVSLAGKDLRRVYKYGDING